MKYYNPTNTCDKIKKIGSSWRRCGKKFEIDHPRREHNDKRNWTGKWFCSSCYYKDLADRRTGKLDPNSSQVMGDLFEKVTSEWIEVKILSEELDNYTLPYDHSRDPELGIIQTRSKLYDTYNEKWFLGSLERERYKEFDNLIFYCISSDGKIIERIYIFPWEEIIERTGISIMKNPSNRNGRCPRGGWYEKYRVKDEDILRRVNEIWDRICAGWDKSLRDWKEMKEMTEKEMTEKEMTEKEMTEKEMKVSGKLDVVR